MVPPASRTVSGMHLVLDLGNTRDKWAVFEGERPLAHGIGGPNAAASTSAFRLDASDLRQILKTHKPTAAIWSATGAPRPELEQVLQTGLSPEAVLALDHHTALPFRMAYQTPETLGRDRIAAVAGARAHVPDGPVLVVDAGTCITTDLLDADNVYRGGSIAPGIRMRLQAMHTMTARLPLVDWQPETGVPDPIGGSTKAAMINGAWWAAAMELEGWIARLGEAHSGLKVLLTGGDGPALAAIAKKAIFAVPLLPLEGLNKILSHNVLQGDQLGKGGS